MLEKYIDNILANYIRIGVEVHKTFILCCYTALESEFHRITGTRLTGRADFAFVAKDAFFVESGVVSRMPVCLFLNHNWIMFIICWQSQSGRIYRPQDEIKDCSDVRFWYENLDVALVQECMYPGGELPFKTGNLGYELEVEGIDMNMHIRLHFLPEVQVEIDEVISKIDKYINGFNLKSEKKDRKDGVVHNWKRHMDEGSLVYELDLGSAGLKFFAGLLKHFARLKLFGRVVVGGY